MRELSLPAGMITGSLGFDLSTIQPTTALMSSIKTATTSKRSAIGQKRKPKPSSPYSPECLKGEFSEVYGGIPHRMMSLRPCRLRVLNPSYRSNKGRLGRVLACKGGMSYGRRQATTEANRLYRGRPRPRTERLDDARLDDLHHRRPRDRTDAKAS